MTSQPRLYAILVTKDDADVIVEVVRHAATFCDKIIQLDNCSTDGTWELMGELEAEDPDRFVRLRQFDEPFYDGIRAEVYNAYRHELGDGWWMMLDSDEMMDRDPRPLLAAAAAAGDDAVHCWLAQFVFTTRDRRAWESGLIDPTAPVTRRVRSYRGRLARAPLLQERPRPGVGRPRPPPPSARLDVVGPPAPSGAAALPVPLTRPDPAPTRRPAWALPARDRRRAGPRR